MREREAEREAGRGMANEDWMVFLDSHQVPTWEVDEAGTEYANRLRVCQPRRIQAGIDLYETGGSAISGDREAFPNRLVRQLASELDASMELELQKKTQLLDVVSGRQSADRHARCGQVALPGVPVAATDAAPEEAARGRGDGRPGGAGSAQGPDGDHVRAGQPDADHLPPGRRWSSRPSRARSVCVCAARGGQRARYDTYGGVAWAVLGNPRRRKTYRQRLKNAMGSIDGPREAGAYAEGGR